MEGSSTERHEAAPRKLRLRYPGRCSICGCDIARGTEAWWDASAKAVTCLVCGSDVELARGLAGTAGASGREKFDRLHARREKNVKRAWGKRVGSVVLALSDDPQSTRAWQTGSVGEEQLARFLERELPESVLALHDRRIPGSQANIDHVVVAPNGVWVIDAKLYRGKVERRTLGPFWRPDRAVFVGGRDRTKLIHGLQRQVGAVTAALAPDPLAAELAVRPVVCFVASDWALFAKPFEIAGVQVTWPQKLVEAIGAPGPLTSTAVVRLANRIGVSLPPAARS
jgi:Nuclease-related domain